MWKESILVNAISANRIWKIYRPRMLYWLMNCFSIHSNLKKNKFKLFSSTSLYKLNFINYFNKNKHKILYYNFILIVQSYYKKKKGTDICVKTNYIPVRNFQSKTLSVFSLSLSRAWRGTPVSYVYICSRAAVSG